MREFKDSITGKDKDDDDEDDDGRHAEPPQRPSSPTVRGEPEVVTGEARPQDQPASRAENT